MTARLYTHIQDTPTEKLLVVLEFFDHPNLRQHFTGLIGDIRAELTARGVSVSYPGKQPTCCERNHGS